MRTSRNADLVRTSGWYARPVKNKEVKKRTNPQAQKFRKSSMKSRISKDWKPEYSRDSKDYDDYFFAPFSLCMLFSMMYVGRFPSTQSHISFFIPNPIFSVL